MAESPIHVCVVAPDPISRAGIVAQLRPRRELHLVEDPDEAAIGLVSVNQLDADSLRTIRALQRNQNLRILLVVATIGENEILDAVEAGVSAIVRRIEATPERLIDVSLSVARGDGSLPSDLLGRLLRQVKSVHDNVLVPRGVNLSGLSDRETKVLQLVSDGYDTKEIASTLSYSERTIKTIIQDVMRRFGLRNRSHAVAFALRQGLI